MKTFSEFLIERTRTTAGSIAGTALLATLLVKGILKPTEPADFVGQHAHEAPTSTVENSEEKEEKKENGSPFSIPIPIIPKIGKNKKSKK